MARPDRTESPRAPAPTQAGADPLVESLRALADAELRREDPPAVPTIPDRAPGESWFAVADRLAAEARALRTPDATHLARRLDDLERRVLFAWMGRTRSDPRESAVALAVARRRLGPVETWLPGFRRWLHDPDRAVLVAVLTWQCELRCSYCSIPKQSGREMAPETIERAVDLLVSTDRRQLQLRFFGGEPLMEWERLTHAIRHAERRAGARPVEFLITTNGWALDDTRLRWLAEHRVYLQVALDGRAGTMDRFRRAVDRGASSYAHSIASRLPLLHALHIPYDIVWVVHPGSVDGMEADFEHLVSLGVRSVQLNYGHGLMWSERARRRFADALHAIGKRLRERWAAGEGPWLTNVGEKLRKVKTFGHTTVDWDGTIMGGNGFLFRPTERDTFVLGHLDDGTGYERTVIDGLTHEQLLRGTFPDPVSRNNAGVGAILDAFVRWMQQNGADDAPRPAWRAGRGHCAVPPPPTTR